MVGWPRLLILQPSPTQWVPRRWRTLRRAGVDALDAGIDLQAALHTRRGSVLGSGAGPPLRHHRRGCPILSRSLRKGGHDAADVLYRLTQKTYPNTTNVEYVYDLVGKLQQVSDPTGTYGFAYDNMGLISTTTNYTFVAGTYTNSYAYDAASNRTSLTAPDGSISTYGYDTLKRLNGLANSWAESFGFGYDALNRRTSPHRGCPTLSRSLRKGGRQSARDLVSPRIVALILALRPHSRTAEGATGPPAPSPLIPAKNARMGHLQRK